MDIKLQENRREQRPWVFRCTKTILIDTTPVALDAVRYQVIDTQRVGKGLPLLKEKPGYHGGPRPLDHLALAAKKGIGISNLGRIKIERIALKS